jgi:hypothetical protein
MRSIKTMEGIKPQLRDYLEALEAVLAGAAGLKWVVTPATVDTAPTAAAWERTVNIELQDSNGVLQEWFTKDITTGVSIADTSSAGTASIPSTTLSIVNGRGSVVVSGDAEAWLGGTAQIETITCTAGESTGAGNITMAITAAGMDNSPKDVVVAIALSDGVNDVAGKVRTALAADADVAAFFAVSGADADVVLTALTPAANDATMEIGFTDTDTTGVTFGASTDTQAGVAKETDTLTVAQATIAGMTVAAKTSVETFTD